MSVVAANPHSVYHRRFSSGTLRNATASPGPPSQMGDLYSLFTKTSQTCLQSENAPNEKSPA